MIYIYIYPRAFNDSFYTTWESKSTTVSGRSRTIRMVRNTLGLPPPLIYSKSWDARVTVTFHHVPNRSNPRRPHPSWHLCLNLPVAAAPCTPPLRSWWRPSELVGSGVGGSSPQTLMDQMEGSNGFVGQNPQPKTCCLEANFPVPQN